MEIPQDWKLILANELDQTYFAKLIEDVNNEYSNNVCYPKKDLIFSAFNYCSFKNLKVIIIGQDPYHGEGEANGLSFSVNEGVKIPPSLRNIFREINDDLNSVFYPTNGNLERWAKQGVLLLNTSLTVRKDLPNSHKKLNWAKFTDAVIQNISDTKEHVVFLLWGAFAQKKINLIDSEKHLILCSGHPSPMSANQGKWFKNKHFSQTNTYLKSKGISEITW